MNFEFGGHELISLCDPASGERVAFPSRRVRPGNLLLEIGASRRKRRGFACAG